MFTRVLWYLFFGTPDPSPLPPAVETLIFVTKRFHIPPSLSQLAVPRLGVSLALGGGFARGYAHLGVLRVFREHAIPVTSIAGSSIGSILCAAYASGEPFPAITTNAPQLLFRHLAP